MPLRRGYTVNNAQTQALCLALMKADSEEEVIGLLEEAGIWDKKDLWRFYGDYGTKGAIHISLVPESGWPHPIPNLPLLS